MTAKRLVFDLSSAKTGTTSLASAMELLGFRSCHGCPAEHENDFCEKLLNGRVDFKLLDEYEFIGNLVNYCFFKLEHRYPEAKFIFLERDVDAWLQSTLRQLQNQRRFGLKHSGTLARLQNIGCLYTKDAEYLKYRFECHRAAVLAYFKTKPEKLLVTSVAEEWPPLCEFLNLPVPSVAFPHLNKSKA